MLQELYNKLSLIEEVTNDIAENFGGKIELSLYEIKNEYGGNSQYRVDMIGSGSHYTLKDKAFIWQPQAQSFNGFINEIKAYMLDVLDGFNNL